MERGQPIDSVALTPGGWRRLSDLREGDLVFDATGRPTTVHLLQDTSHGQVWRLSFNDRTSIESGIDQRWYVQSTDRRSRGKSAVSWPPHLIAMSRTPQYVALPHPVILPAADLPLHPYLLGALLGDGGISKKQAYFATGDAEMIERLSVVLPPGVEFRQRNTYWWSIAAPCCGKPNPVIRALRLLGLQGSRAERKWIPSDYKVGSIQQRVELLQGLLDTDGTSCPPQPIVYTTTSPQLARDLSEIVRSLGGVTRTVVRVRVHLPLHYVTVFLPVGIPAFALRRKVDRYARHGRYRGLNRRITRSEPVGRKDLRVVWTESGTYLSNDHIVVDAGLWDISSINELFARNAASYEFDALVLAA